jgi:3-hydroxybutyryl-CoA dehydratase
MREEFYVKPGDSVTFAKTVGETDIYLFAGITGDFAVNHVNEQYMARSKYGRRIAHGVLVLGFASTCSSMMIEKCHGTAGDETAVSLGYDKVRFLGPVYIGDTLTLTYTIIEVDPIKRRSRSDIKVINQTGELVAVAPFCVFFRPFSAVFSGLRALSICPSVAGSYWRRSSRKT